jgi:hypothetical protein
LPDAIEEAELLADLAAAGGVCCGEGARRAMATADTADRQANSTPPRPPDAQSDAYLAWLRDLLWPDRVERFGGVLLVSSAPVPEHQAAMLDLGA